jgi:hypothetical protein
MYSLSWEYMIMIRKIVVFGIISLLFIGYISMAQEIELNNNILNRGKFRAQLGLGRDERPAYHLDGNFNTRGRFRLVRGTLTNSEMESRFQGTFIGNRFIMKIPLRGRTLTLFGHIRVNDDYSIFSGSWIGRGIDTNGWISGEFITRG